MPYVIKFTPQSIHDYACEVYLNVPNKGHRTPEEWMDWYDEVRQQYLDRGYEQS